MSIDLAISFDDTGSMYAVRRQVRAQAKDLVDRLSKDLPGIRFAIIIHNDYCDMPNHMYVQNFTTDLNVVKKFIDRDSPAGGGDAPECYELALQEAKKLSWQSDRKALVMIGDEIPHSVGYRYGSHVNNIDWRKEAQAIGDMGIPIYGVQALGRSSSNFFYEGISKMTGGIRLDLAQFQHIVTYINAIAYKQSGQLEEYQNSDPTFTKNMALKAMFNKLRGLGAGAALTEEKIELLAKFQVMTVREATAIKQFVEENGCTYRKGKGYYQLIERTEDGKANREIIQANKEVIFVDKETGEANADTAWCREQLKVPFGTKGGVSPLSLPDVMNKYKIFVQSNSYTRVLDKGTEFLFELEHK
jgi:hypothetical protein